MTVTLDSVAIQFGSDRGLPSVVLLCDGSGVDLVRASRSALWVEARHEKQNANPLSIRLAGLGSNPAKLIVRASHNYFFRNLHRSICAYSTRIK